MNWTNFDTWVVLTASVAAMACSIPGTLLMLRRQSLMGDALSHALLPGIVLGYLFVAQAEQIGLISSGIAFAARPLWLFAGALLSGLVVATLSDVITRWGHLDANASLGVVYSSLFALGLLLMRLTADQIDLDPGCVLLGSLEAAANQAVLSGGPPRAFLTCGAMLILNAAVLILCFKEFRITLFDPQFAETLGYPTWRWSVTTLALASATIVTAFECVGSILVISLLITPAATAWFWTDRLPIVFVLAAAFGVISAISGHIFAITLPGPIMALLGWPHVADASSSGSMALAAALLFAISWIFAPQYGLAWQWLSRWRDRQRMRAEDLLGQLYRAYEQAESSGLPPTALKADRHRAAATWLLRKNLITRNAEGGLSLTTAGREAGQALVRSHRLWEAYMAEHWSLPPDHLHATAEHVEHFLDADLRAAIDAELRQPAVDPHGQKIPSEVTSSTASGGTLE